MIHVATVHYRSDRWIEPQLRYLERFLPGPFRVYTFLTRVPGDHSGKFFYSSTEEVKDHATKLNLLGDVISFAAEDASDPLVFIDGDAFPVTPIGPLIDQRLARNQLIAVQRHENNGDIQPHPCFCLTTVGFWSRIGGDWHRGYEWLDPHGAPITDVGANVLAALERERVDWYPLRRVNTVNDHPLFFALYGDEQHGPVVYHHGSGFRDSAGGRRSRLAYGEREAKASLAGRVAKRLPKHGPLGKVRRRLNPARRLRDSLRAETRELSEGILAEMKRDDEFWRRFVPQ
jgi:hypothetical protein